jgi:hypothetical protein
VVLNMATDALKHALSTTAKTQADVNYIMTETRKLLERLNLMGQHDDLVFFCDWTVHSKLDRSKAKAIVAEFDTVILEVARTLSHTPFTERLKRIVSLDLLRDELRSVFTTHGLPTNLLDNTGQWAAFVVLYISVVRDCPLELRNGYCLQVKHIDIGDILLTPTHHTTIVTKWDLTHNGVHVGTIINEGYVETPVAGT